MTTPHGLQQIVETFGQSCKPACHGGFVVLPAPIGNVKEFYCHELLAETFTNVYAQINDVGCWSMLHSFGGCYACRAIRGKEDTSTHAWGIANDLNAQENPLTSTPSDILDEQHPYVFTADHPVVKIFKANGFIWGGEFLHRKDPMHFQFASGY
ncbi:MAG TPA: M15 family metallopeptidase [Candidatus Kapabacteria bacterium]|nr:M15 family metallopeptidase [Candidatus Kapabacteria bacterium]